MLKLKLPYFGHLMGRTDSLEKTLMERLKAGGEGDDRGWDGWMASPTQWTWVWASSRNWWWTGRPGVLQSMGSQRVGYDRATELNWTTPPPSPNSTMRACWLRTSCFFTMLVFCCVFSSVLNSARQEPVFPFYRGGLWGQSRSTLWEVAPLSKEEPGFSTARNLLNKLISKSL